MKYQTLLETEIKYSMRHRVRRQTMGKDAIKKSMTKVHVIGQGTGAIPQHVLVVTDVGSRIASGATTDILAKQDTGNVCNVGNIIKYINICIEAGSTNVTGDVPTPDDNGWLEYAIVKSKEATIAPAITNIGTRTLGDICTTDFRGDVIFTGCLPIGASQTSAVDIKIKLPKIFTKMQWGSKLLLYIWNRSVNTTDVRTNSLKVITSALYKVYV